MKTNFYLFFIYLFYSVNISAQTATNVSVLDTRGSNLGPNSYSKEAKFEFKARDIVGVPGTRYYSGMLTIAPWASGDNSGNKHHQLNFNDGGIYYRTGLPQNTSWDSWKSIVLTDANGNVDVGGKISSSGTINSNSAYNLPAFQFGGGSYIRSNGTYLVFQQNGGDADKTFYINGFGNIVKDGNVVYHAGNINKSDIDFNAQNLNCYRINTSRQGIGIDGSGYGSPWGIGKDNTLGLYFYESGTINQYRMLIKDGGNVLIGKTTQSNTTYKLDVAGKIRADEIVVNTTGADFVFEPNYKLRPLCEVETFIKQHKHLPDISPAIDMQTNGANLGEMQTKLLQKLEESTLYLIEQSKQIEALKKENEQKEKKYNQLEAQLQQLTKMVQTTIVKH